MDEYVFSVTELVGCPYFTREQPVTEEGLIAFQKGTERHYTIEEILKTRGFLVEEPIDYMTVYKSKVVWLKGKIDCIDPRNKVIYEIKSRNLTMRALRQLLLYRDIFYLARNEVYGIGFILYRQERGVIKLEFIRNFLYVPPLLEMYKNIQPIIEFVIEKEQMPRIACEDCKICRLRGECRPDFRYHGLQLVRLK